MKFTCDQQILVKALNSVERATSARTPLPITQGILMEADGGLLTLTATNMDLAIEQKIVANVEEPGATVIMGSLLTDIIKKMPEVPISFALSGEKVDIKAGDIEFHLVALNPADFPNMKQVDTVANPVTLGKDTFIDMIKQTIFATSKDESKGALTGIKVEIEDGTATFIAIDGFRLAVRRESVNEKNKFEFLVPGKTMEEISKIANESPDIKISLGRSMSSFAAGDVTIYTRLLDTKDFVAWKSLIPNENKIQSEIDLAVLKSSLERVAIFADDKNSLVKFDINGDITLTSKSEVGNVREVIPAKTVGGNLEIGFNAKYLIDAIKVIGDDAETKMTFTESIKPALVVPTEGDAYLYMVLPVRI